MEIKSTINAFLELTTCGLQSSSAGTSCVNTIQIFPQQKERSKLAKPIEIDLKQVTDSNEKYMREVAWLKEINHRLKNDLAYLKTELLNKDTQIKMLSNKVNELENKNDNTAEEIQFVSKGSQKIMTKYRRPIRSSVVTIKHQ